MNNLLILIECHDRVGLVTHITNVLAQHQLNIIAMREFVDESENKFFTRIACNGIVEDVAMLEQELLSVLPIESKATVVTKSEKNIAVLVTKEFHCLADLLVRNHFKTLGAVVKCVIGNHQTLKEFAEKLNIPFFMCLMKIKQKLILSKKLTAF
jgi:formyltetrahydrofolate deformylase